ncbi:High mobility group B protein 15 [Sesamum alatum]|uniref:High mobility group B protein 15 n=1 Tax=Sesamum alatum TaxID=300844 RepID=A0AAE1Y1W1_9LAMI|nr:High mobility group B protein 15 [Sesamum alatum]
MLPNEIVKILAEREKKVFMSDSEDEEVEKKPASKKRKSKKSGLEPVMLKNIPPPQCVQNSLEFLKKQKMQVPRSSAVLNNSNQALRLLSTSGLLKLKPLYHGKDQEISRIIRESWNKLQEPERTVYQEKALKDKERYKIEMEDYRERLRTGQIIRSAMPVQQGPPVPEANSTDLNSNLHFGGAATASAYTKENEMSSEKSDKSNLEEYESADKDSDLGEYPQADMELKTGNIEVMVDEAFDLQTRLDRVGQDNKNPGHGAADDDKMLLSTDNNMVLGEDGISVPIEEREQPPSNANESTPSL